MWDTMPSYWQVFAPYPEDTPATASIDITMDDGFASATIVNGDIECAGAGVTRVCSRVRAGCVLTVGTHVRVRVFVPGSLRCGGRRVADCLLAAVGWNHVVHDACRAFPNLAVQCAVCGVRCAVCGVRCACACETKLVLAHGRMKRKRQERRMHKRLPKPAIHARRHPGTSLPVGSYGLLDDLVSTSVWFQELESFYLPLVIASWDVDPHFDGVISSRARVAHPVRPLLL
jgi:hypothetical protein